MINSKVLVNNDTLEIINTDWIEINVTLENDKTYHYNYIKNKFIDNNVKKKIDSIILLDK